MKDGNPSTTYLKNYTQSNFLIEKTDLKFELNDEISFVTSNLVVRKNLHVPNVDPTLMLHGNKNLQLLWVEVDGVRLEDDVVVQNGGEPINLMKDIPIEIEEIEDLMNS